MPVSHQVGFLVVACAAVWVASFSDWRAGISSRHEWPWAPLFVTAVCAALLLISHLTT